MHTVAFALMLIDTGVALALLGVAFVRSVVAGRARVKPQTVELTATAPLRYAPRGLKGRA